MRLKGLIFQGFSSTFVPSESGSKLIQVGIIGPGQPFGAQG